MGQIAPNQTNPPTHRPQTHPPTHPPPSPWGRTTLKQRSVRGSLTYNTQWGGGGMVHNLLTQYSAPYPPPTPTAKEGGGGVTAGEGLDPTVQRIQQLLPDETAGERGSAACLGPEGGRGSGMPRTDGTPSSRRMKRPSFPATLKGSTAMGHGTSMRTRTEGQERRSGEHPHRKGGPPTSNPRSISVGSAGQQRKSSPPPPPGRACPGMY